MSIITLNTRSLPDSAVTTAKINADAVTDAKVADDVIGTEHLTAGEVDATALGADSVTAAKINDDIISGTTALTSAPADTDEFLVSDAGTLKRIDYSLIKGSGKILQVLQGAHGSQASMSSTSFVDVSSDTNVSLTCASTSSKVLIIANFIELYLNGSHGVKIRVTAGGTQIMRSDGLAITGASGEKVIGETLVFLYSPNSTSAIEYKMQFGSSDGTEVRVNQHGSGDATLTLMEVGA